jgi:tetratricopeptide (TPR) repeat protein
MSAQMDSERPVPRKQVEKQLQAILSSDVFAGGGKYRKVEKPSELLGYIVTKTLDGETVTDSRIHTDFYVLPKHLLKEGNATARIGVLRLRKKLNTYNATLGLNDAVLIQIPFGQSGAVFKWNPRSRAQKEVRAGFYHVDRESPSDIKQALIHFGKAIELEPEFAEGYAGKASALLTMTLHAYFQNPEELFKQAERAATTALKLDNDCWQAHANLGAVHLFRHEWAQADTAFAKAERLSPLEIESIGGYGPFLLSRGRSKEGLALAHRYLDEGYFEDVVLVGRAGLYFYACRCYPEAEEALLLALEMDPHFWRSHMILAFLYLSTEKPEQALSHMLRVEPLSGMNLWPGLRVLCLETAGHSAEAEKEFLRLHETSKETYIQPMQLALGCMALGDRVAAISYLDQACDESDPFTAWLHLWPFLDSLRTFREFRELIRKRKFPDA